MKSNNFIPEADTGKIDQSFSAGTRIIKGMVEESLRKNRRVAIIAHSMSAAHMAQMAASLIIDSQNQLVRVISSEEIGLVVDGEQAIHLYPNYLNRAHQRVEQCVVDEYFVYGNHKRDIGVTDDNLTQEVIQAFEREVFTSKAEIVQKPSFPKPTKRQWADQMKRGKNK